MFSPDQSWFSQVLNDFLNDFRKNWRWLRLVAQLSGAEVLHVSNPAALRRSPSRCKEGTHLGPPWEFPMARRSGNHLGNLLGPQTDEKWWVFVRDWPGNWQFWPVKTFELAFAWQMKHGRGRPLTYGTAVPFPYQYCKTTLPRNCVSSWFFMQKTNLRLEMLRIHRFQCSTSCSILSRRGHWPSYPQDSRHDTSSAKHPSACRREA